MVTRHNDVVAGDVPGVAAFAGMMVRLVPVVFYTCMISTAMAFSGDGPAPWNVHRVFTFDTTSSNGSLLQ
jgi:hypothetical protein